MSLTFYYDRAEENQTMALLCCVWFRQDVDNTWTGGARLASGFYFKKYYLSTLSLHLRMYTSFPKLGWREFLWGEETKYYLLIGEGYADERIRRGDQRGRMWQGHTACAGQRGVTWHGARDKTEVWDKTVLYFQSCIPAPSQPNQGIRSPWQWGCFAF